MSDSNTYSKLEYISYSIMYGIASMTWFNSFLFRNIDGMSYDRSRLILWFMFAVSLITGTALTWKNRRSNLNMIVNIAIPIDIYAVITYRKTLPKLFIIVLLVAFSFAVIKTVRIFRHRIKPGANRNLIIKKRIFRSFFVSRTILSCSVLIAVFFLFAGSVFNIFPFSPTVIAEKRAESTDAVIEDNRKTINLLYQKNWVELSTEEKLNVLQVIANIESNRLGLTHELKVVTGRLKENTLAQYSNDTHVISIDMNHLEYDPSIEILNSVCHEARHAYQHNMCDLYENIDEKYKNLSVFWEVQQYKAEFSDYTDGKMNINAYSSQKCEEDARLYADDSMIYYYFELGDNTKMLHSTYPSVETLAD